MVRTVIRPRSAATSDMAHAPPEACGLRRPPWSLGVYFGFHGLLQPDHEGVADGVIEGVRQAGPGEVVCAPPCERQRNAKSDVHDNEFRQLEWERQTMRDGQVP